jgi:hypothetical protein
VNRDEIIEAEVEKAEQRYYIRCAKRLTLGNVDLDKPTLVWDFPGVREEEMAHFRLDLAEIAELYGFDPATGLYFAFDSPSWSLSQLQAMRERSFPEMWKTIGPDSDFSIGWANPWLPPLYQDTAVPTEDNEFWQAVHARSAGAIHDPAFTDHYHLPAEDIR